MSFSAFSRSDGIWSCTWTPPTSLKCPRFSAPLSVPFVIDHMGRVKADGGLEQRPFRALLDLMKLDTCWVKVCGAERVSTAGPPFLDAVPFARAIVNAAPDRVLWGTDWPHPNVGRLHAERR